MIHRQLIVNGILIHYYSIEVSQKKDAIVFLHGWRSEGRVWQQQMTRLQESGVPSVSIDFPGFGVSETPKKTFTLQDYADIITTMVERLELSKVTLVGHSFGGRVAIKIAAVQPAWLDRLVLIDSAGFRNTSGSVQLKKGIASLVRPVFKLPMLHGLRKRMYRSIGAEDYVATPQLQQTFVNVINEDLTEQLPRITIPVQLIWGAEDTDTPVEFSYRMKQLIPHAGLEVIPKAGHFSFIDQPEKVFTIIRAFIHTPHV